MKLATIRSEHGPRVAVLVEGRGLADVRSAYAARLRREQGHAWLASFEAAERTVPADMTSMLDSWDTVLPVLQDLHRWLGSSGAWDVPFVDPEGADFLAPVPRPRKVFGARSNYWDHHHEMAEKKGTAPDVLNNPAGFFKASSSVIGTGEEIVIPEITKVVHHEIELTAVFGRRGQLLSEEDAWSVIAGYTIMNDVSARDLARDDNGWVDRGKGIDTFGPMGPYLVTADELEDPGSLHIELKVNGEVRQEGNTSDLIFNIPYLVSFLSRSFTWEPGDALMTGTCKGVGPIEPGDLVEATIEGIGTLRNRVVAGRGR